MGKLRSLSRACTLTGIHSIDLHGRDPSNITSRPDGQATVVFPIFKEREPAMSQVAVQQSPCLSCPLILLLMVWRGHERVRMLTCEVILVEALQLSTYNIIQDPSNPSQNTACIPARKMREGRRLGRILTCFRGSSRRIDSLEHPTRLKESIVDHKILYSFTPKAEPNWCYIA